jgi:hypothetical protein
MGRPNEIAHLIKNNNSPSEISKMLRISIGSIISYMNIALFEDLIWVTDILLSIPSTERSYYDDLSEWNQLYLLSNHELKIRLSKISSIIFTDPQLRDSVSFNYDNCYIYVKYSEKLKGDFYSYIALIETIYHRLIKEILLDAYDSNQTIYNRDDLYNWWRKGIPVEIRVKLVEAFERDTEPASSPYCYTNFIVMADVIKKNWNLFEKYLPNDEKSNKKAYLDKFVTLNRYRNIIMHPIKGIYLGLDDFIFIKEFFEELQIVDDNFKKSK